MPTQDQITRRKAIRAEAARRRRADAGATPRNQSRAAQLRIAGESANTFYSRARRDRLRGNETPAAPIVAVDPPAPDPAPAIAPEPMTAEAACLLQQVRHLPGGRDPTLHAALIRLSANVAAARDAWAGADSELAALLAADDPPTYH